MALYLDFLLDAVGDFLQIQLQFDAQVGAAAYALPLPTTAATPEKGAER